MPTFLSAICGFCCKNPREFSRGKSRNPIVLGEAEEGAEFLLAALQGDPQRAGEHQAEHLHKALAIHPMGSVIEINGKRLRGGYFCKLIHIPDRAKTYHKIFGIFHLALYKPFFFVYNGKRFAKLPIKNIISNPAENAIVGLDDYNNNSSRKLAVITYENQLLYIGM